MRSTTARWCLLLFSIVTVEARQRPQIDQIPHCTTDAVVEGEVQLRNANDTSTSAERDEIWWTSQLRLSLNETACFVVKENRTSLTISTLHTIKYARLEHRYGIAETYQFGIPEIRQSCKCDCPGGETICSVDDYHYRNCSSGTLCYRTHYSALSSKGCITSGESDLCCQIQIDPYKQMKFKAVRLKQPDTYIVLQYGIFERRNGKWKAEMRDKDVRIPLNAGSVRIDEDEHSLRIKAGSGRPHRQLSPGMYFWDVNERQLRGNVLLNEFGESRLDRLGWLRWENGRWTVRRGLEKFTREMHVSVDNCKAQRYRFSIEAEQYVLLSNDMENNENHFFHLGNLTADEPYIRAVELGEREVNIIHAEGAELSLNIQTKSRPSHIVHSSEFNTFNGTIQLDSESKSFMNLTFYEVCGTMIGELYRDSTSDAVEMMFSVQTVEQKEQSYQTIVEVPATVNSRRKVCIHPSGQPAAQKCVWLEYTAEAVRETNFMSYYWVNSRTECEGCNERGLDGFLESLNPKRWLMNGFQTPTDVFVVVVEVVLCLATILLALLILTKCVIPMFRCLWCVTKPLKTTSSRRTKSSLQLISTDRY
ncbi:Transmembrane protein 26 family-containing protein [Aphelenchoides besseyi]|nr:Transmembrane protein 26 family-containing protein [Aphelenchoides besseyi]